MNEQTTQEVLQSFANQSLKAGDEVRVSNDGFEIFVKKIVAIEVDSEFPVYVSTENGGAEGFKFASFN